MKHILFHARARRGSEPASSGVLPAAPDRRLVEDVAALDTAASAELDAGPLTEDRAHREPVSSSGVVPVGPRPGDVRLSETFTAADCPCCFRPLIVSWKDARPASDVLQDAFGCDPADLYRFFEPDDWLQTWELPLQLTWGTAEDWRAIAGIWRAARARKEGGFMSLQDIELASKPP